MTSYSRDWYINNYIKHIKMTKVDKRLFNYLKFTYSKEDGKYKFFGLPKGEYYLIININREGSKKLIVKKVFINKFNNYMDVDINEIEP